jgi:hypothetical protein
MADAAGVIFLARTQQCSHPGDRGGTKFDDVSII